MKEKIKIEIKQFLDSKNYKYEEDEDMIYFGLDVDDGAANVFILIAFEDDGWIILARSDEIPEKWNLENKYNVAMILSRLNFMLEKGVFQFDDHDGEIRYKKFTEICPEMIGNDIIKTLIRRDINVAVKTIVRHQDAIIKAINGTESIDGFVEYALELAKKEDLSKK